MNKCLFSSNTDEWYTPKKLIDDLKKEFQFTLDPCACDDSHITSKYYTKQDNGLNKCWKNEIVFCNPPYSNIKMWCEKCAFENQVNNATIVLLIPARTDTTYFHEYVLPYCEIRFLKGRLKFSNCKNSAPFPSLLCIYRGVENG